MILVFVKLRGLLLPPQALRKSEEREEAKRLRENVSIFWQFRRFRVIVLFRDFKP